LSSDRPGNDANAPRGLGLTFRVSPPNELTDNPFASPFDDDHKVKTAAAANPFVTEEEEEFGEFESAPAPALKPTARDPFKDLVYAVPKPKQNLRREEKRGSLEDAEISYAELLEDAVLEGLDDELQPKRKRKDLGSYFGHVEAHEYWRSKQKRTVKNSAQEVDELSYAELSYAKDAESWREELDAAVAASTPASASAAPPPTPEIEAVDGVSRSQPDTGMEGGVGVGSPSDLWKDMEDMEGLTLATEGGVGVGSPSDLWKDMDGLTFGKEEMEGWASEM
jgi:hypothetical protein